MPRPVDHLGAGRRHAGSRPRRSRRCGHARRRLGRSPSAASMRQHVRAAHDKLAARRQRCRPACQLARRRVAAAGSPLRARSSPPAPRAGRSVSCSCHAPVVASGRNRIPDFPSAPTPLRWQIRPTLPTVIAHRIRHEPPSSNCRRNSRRPNRKRCSSSSSPAAAASSARTRSGFIRRPSRAAWSTSAPISTRKARCRSARSRSASW